jgi:hypothetical protein
MSKGDELIATDIVRMSLDDLKTERDRLQDIMNSGKGNLLQAERLAEIRRTIDRIESVAYRNAR